MVSDCGFPRVVQGILHQNSGALPYTGNMGAQVQGEIVVVMVVVVTVVMMASLEAR